MNTIRFAPPAHASARDDGIAHDLPSRGAASPFPSSFLIPSTRYLLSLGMTPEFAARYDPEIADMMRALLAHPDGLSPVRQCM